ncbi:MAG: cell division protein ZapA [Candidatus Schekmanbacteria bacterium]|nr:cell division protein ZapA [Candidatus Schekmanbacteria bacterium]
MENSILNKKEIQVDIFGKTYTLMYEGDHKYLMDVASYVDEKMKGISSGANIIDSFKVAVLASLQIAEELFNARKELNQKAQAGDERTAALLDLINKNIKEFE